MSDIKELLKKGNNALQDTITKREKCKIADTSIIITEEDFKSMTWSQLLEWDRNYYSKWDKKKQEKIDGGSEEDTSNFF